MSLKILGGIAQGYFLEVPKTDLVRPTQVLIRRRIFDYYQDFSEFNFIDLCAGSGSMGIEAWSRGASFVFFSEPNKKIYDVLVTNIQNVERKYQVSKNVKYSLLSAEKAAVVFLNEIRSRNLEEQTAIFIDPPYEKHEIYESLIRFFIEQKFKGVLWIESDLVKGPSKEKLLKDLKLIREFSHGDSFVLMTEI